MDLVAVSVDDDDDDGDDVVFMPNLQISASL